MLFDYQRTRFDTILDRLMATLPDDLQQRLEEIPLIIDDEPPPHLLRKMKFDNNRTELCGLHWGTPLTHRSVLQTSRLPDRIMLFRGPIIRVTAHLASLEDQIRITLLHEIGHHFGLDEDDLRRLGYG